MEKTIFETTIIRHGESAKEMLAEKMIVLFGKEVPPLVDDISFVHSSNELSAAPSKGDLLTIDDAVFEIDQVGDLVYKNLSELGHCVIQFVGKDFGEDILPGTFTVLAESMPPIDIDTVIKIKKK